MVVNINHTLWKEKGQTGEAKPFLPARHRSMVNIWFLLCGSGRSAAVCALLSTEFRKSVPHIYSLQPKELLLPDVPTVCPICLCCNRSCWLLLLITDFYAACVIYSNNCRRTVWLELQQNLSDICLTAFNYKTVRFFLSQSSQLNVLQQLPQRFKLFQQQPEVNCSGKVVETFGSGVVLPMLWTSPFHRKSIKMV